MEWRCEWCGKPHEENDPPCDNCGHGQFEKAVVRQTDLSEEGGGPALVWVCTECGREHPKNSPPCSRCGSASLEKRHQEIDESDLAAPGYLDLLTPGYLAVAGIALVLGVVFVLGVTGVVDLPGFGDEGVPTVENVPGNATSAGSVPLAAVEDEFVETLNQQRRSAGDGELQRNGDLNDVARNLNQQSVRSVYAGGEPPTITGEMRDVAADACGGGRIVPVTVAVQADLEGATASSLGERLADEFRDDPSRTVEGGRLIGLDVHRTPDDGLALLLVSC